MDEPLGPVGTQYVHPITSIPRERGTDLRSHCHLSHNVRCSLPRLQHALSPAEVVSCQLDGSRAYGALQIRIAASDAESTTSGRCCIGLVRWISGPWKSARRDMPSRNSSVRRAGIALQGKWAPQQNEFVYPLRMVHHRLDGDEVHDGKCMGTAGSIGDTDEGDIVVLNARTL